MNCIDTIDHSRIKVAEKSRKAIFLNPEKNQYKRGRIDGCLVYNEICADYFVSGEGKTVIVELKGCDVARATKQLFAAADHESVKPHLDGQIGFLIICSRYPSHNTTVQIAKQKAKKIYGAKLIILNRERDVSLSMF